MSSILDECLNRAAESEIARRHNVRTQVIPWLHLVRDFIEGCVIHSLGQQSLDLLKTIRPFISQEGDPVVRSLMRQIATLPTLSDSDKSQVRQNEKEAFGYVSAITELRTAAEGTFPEIKFAVWQLSEALAALREPTTDYLVIEPNFWRLSLTHKGTLEMSGTGREANIYCNALSDPPLLPLNRVSDAPTPPMGEGVHDVHVGKQLSYTETGIEAIYQNLGIQPVKEAWSFLRNARDLPSVSNKSLYRLASTLSGTTRNLHAQKEASNAMREWITEGEGTCSVKQFFDKAEQLHNFFDSRVSRFGALITQAYEECYHTEPPSAMTNILTESMEHRLFQVGFIQVDKLQFISQEMFAAAELELALRKKMSKKVEVVQVPNPDAL